MIKLADTSEAGWGTVREYEANPIASDSDDDTKISRAETRALRKRKRLQEKKKPVSGRYGNSGASAFPHGLQPAGMFNYGFSGVRGPAPPNFSQFGFGSPFPVQRARFRPPGANGACFSCGLSFQPRRGRGRRRYQPQAEVINNKI